MFSFCTHFYYNNAFLTNRTFYAWKFGSIMDESTQIFHLQQIRDPSFLFLIKDSWRNFDRAADAATHTLT
jgi:hypothetical protein